MEELRLFASFIKTHKLDDLTRSQLEFLHAHDVSILKQVQHLGEEETYRRTKESNYKFLVALEAGTALEMARQNLEQWGNAAAPEIAKTTVSLADISWIHRSQKLALILQLPYYSRDVAVTNAITLELEEYFHQLQLISIRVMDGLRQLEQQLLLETEEKYKDLFDNASDLVHMSRPDGSIIYANNAWINTLGYTLEELTGTSIYQYVSVGERENFRKSRERILANPTSGERVDTLFMTRDGQEIFLEGFVSCKYKDGLPAYTRGILHNVTTRKKSEEQLQYYNEQLQEGQERLRQLIRHAPDAIIVIDEEGRILIWNPKAEVVFGWEADEVVGQMLAEVIIPPAYREAHSIGMKRYLSTGEARVLNNTIEVTALNKSGNEFYIALTISQSMQGGRSRFIAFIRNIDQHKRDQLELERKREQLVRSNKELEQYAWLTSHDLKEPVRKIITFSDILLQRYQHQLDDMGVTSLRKIHESSRRMTHLIDAILHYSNVSGNETSRTDTDLNHILRDVLSDLEIMIRESNATVDVQHLPVIHADPVQMRQLFQNLLSNAIQYRKPETPPVIRISTAPAADGIKIRVKDNGQGFDPAYAEKIFKIFQRLVSHQQYEGTGIGLALCKKIVEQHGGTITAIGEEGKGSIFEISLPLK